MRTGLCIDERFLAHRPPREHPERPERLAAIYAGLRAAGLVERCVAVPARPATRDELLLAHGAAHVDALARALSHEESGWLDEDTYYGPGSWQAALLAVGGTIDLATLVACGRLDNGAVFARPPGHHATRDRAMGFCLLNQVAVAAARLCQLGRRVAIFDWDVHHGNGTEAIFAAVPDVLYVSTHEAPQYPGTGLASYIGSGPGLGFTVNVPLSRGTAAAHYLEAYEERVRPAIERFRPELILVSAGFDAHRRDPLGGLRLESTTYATLTRDLLAICPRVVVSLEGGYDLPALAEASVVVLETLLQGGA